MATTARQTMEVQMGRLDKPPSAHTPHNRANARQLPGSQVAARVAALEAWADLSQLVQCKSAEICMKTCKQQRQQ